MELREYLHIVWTRKVLIILCVAVSVGLALAISAQMEPTYAATAKVVVGPRAIEKDDAVGALQEITMSEEFVTTYAEILRSRPLAEAVVSKTKASISADELTKRVETNIIPETRLIEVTVTGGSPAEAARYANETVSLFVQDEGNRFGGGTPVTATVLQSALEPEAPVSPKPLQNGLIAGLLGLMLGTGIAFLLAQLDSTVKTKEDVERIFNPLPAIATIPLAPNNGNSSIFLKNAPNSPASEAIRILRTNIQFFSVDHPVQRLLVTSTSAGEGKTTVAINLAASIAATNQQVLLIEADLRRPAFKGYFPYLQGQGGGLSEVLSGRTGLKEAVRKTDIPNLSVIVAGQLPPNPAELLSSERMAGVLDLASTMAEVIILDTPPALPVTDAAALGALSDGIILVVRAGKTNGHQALGVVQNFERHGARVLGVALNALEASGNGNYYYHYAAAGPGGGSIKARKRAAKLDDQVVASGRAMKGRVAAFCGSTPTVSPPVVRAQPNGRPGSAVAIPVDSRAAVPRLAAVPPEASEPHEAPKVIATSIKLLRT